MGQCLFRKTKKMQHDEMTKKVQQLHTYVYNREWYMGEIMFLILLLSAPRKPKLWKNREMFLKRHSELKCEFPFEHSSFIKLNAIYLLTQTCIPSLLTFWDWGKVNHNFQNLRQSLLSKNAIKFPKDLYPTVYTHNHSI